MERSSQKTQKNKEESTSHSENLDNTESDQINETKISTDISGGDGATIHTESHIGDVHHHIALLSEEWRDSFHKAGMFEQRESIKVRPTKFYRGQIENVEKYRLSEHIKACQGVLNKENIILITCVDKSILNGVIDFISDAYVSSGHEIQELFYEDYDSMTISKIVKAIVERDFKWQGKLILFVRDSGTYGSGQQPPSIRDLNKIESNQEARIKGLIRETGCKIIYVSSSTTYTKTVFKNYHINFLEPFLNFYDRFDLIDSINDYQQEKRIPQNELELLDCLKSSLNEDEFETAIATYEVNKKIFIDALDKEGVYPYVLFVGTFFRGLEFDEFQDFLFLLIEQVEKEEEAEKLMHHWNKQADNILKETGLNNTDQANFRLIDFNQEADAKSCKNVLVKERRVLVDRMANVITSTTFFFYQNFRPSTTQKMNVFIAIFGQAYGRYYKHEVPFSFLDIIEETAERLKKTRRPKRKSRSDNETLKLILKKCKALKKNQPSYYFFRSINLLQINNIELKEIIRGLPHLKYLIQEELRLPENFSLEQVMPELKIVKEKAEQLVDYTNQQWTIANGEYNYLIRRFSSLLIEMELDANSAQVVDLILDEAVDNQGRYNSVFDVINELYYRSDKPVLSWYIKSLSSSKRNERERAFWGMFDLLSLDPTNFHKLFAELITHFPVANLEEVFSLKDKQLGLCIFLHFHSHSRQKQNELDKSNNQIDEAELAFQESIFNSGIKQVEEFIPNLVELFTLVEFKEIYEELFHNDPYFKYKSSHQMAIEVFLFWYRILSGVNQEKIITLLVDVIKSNIKKTVVQRSFKQAIKELRSKYNKVIINSTNHVERKQAIEKRDQFVQFIKLIQ
jgi:hypothetical protein